MRFIIFAIIDMVISDNIVVITEVIKGDDVTRCIDRFDKGKK